MYRDLIMFIRLTRVKEHSLNIGTKTFRTGMPGIIDDVLSSERTFPKHRDENKSGASILTTSEGL